MHRGYERKSERRIEEDGERKTENTRGSGAAQRGEKQLPTVRRRDVSRKEIVDQREDGSEKVMEMGRETYEDLF